MISKFELTNYKAFKDAKIEIRPLTILIGANSVGKSSIIQFLLLLEQTFWASGIKKYKSAFKLNGHNVSLGESINIHHNLNSKIPIEFGFDFSSTHLIEIIKRDVQYDFLENIFRNLDALISSDLEDSIKEKLIEAIGRIKDIHGNNLYRFDSKTTGYRRPFTTRKKSPPKILPQEFENLINEVSDLFKEHGFKISQIRELTFSSFLGTSRRRPYTIHVSTKNDLIWAYKFLWNLSEKMNDKFNISFEIVSAEKFLRIREFCLKNQDDIIIKYRKDMNFGEIGEFKSSFSDFNINKNAIYDLDKIFDFEGTIFNCVKKGNYREETSIIPSIFRIILLESLDVLKGVFRPGNIHYVSPLRANPKRYYFLDKASVNFTFNTYDGDSIAETLKDNASLVTRINEWLDEFGFSVRISPVQDIIHQLKVSQNGIDLDITDVGFGISQVLPVIIQSFLSKKESLTIIEQPEIHLHPKMQAELADLFIKIATDLHKEPSIMDNNLIEAKYEIEKYLLIETHSEYFLKRLRRRIAEGRISHKDVAIYTFNYDNKAKCAVISETKIEERGFFEWPTEYYGEELIEDMKSFMNFQRF